MNTTTDAQVAPVANLSEARKSQAQARKAAKASSEKPALQVPMRERRAPAKKAPAKKAPAKAADKPAEVKLRWKALSDEPANTGPAAANAGDGTVYSVIRSDDKWAAVVTRDGKSTTLVTGGRSTAYRAAVSHARGEWVAP